MGQKDYLLAILDFEGTDQTGSSSSSLVLQLFLRFLFFSRLLSILMLYIPRAFGNGTKSVRYPAGSLNEYCLGVYISGIQLNYEPQY